MGLELKSNWLNMQHGIIVHNSENATQHVAVMKKNVFPKGKRSKATPTIPVMPRLKIKERQTKVILEMEQPWS